MLSLLKKRRLLSIISLSLIITFSSWIFPYQFPLLQPETAKASTTSVANPQVSAGAYHSLVLTSNGKIWAWGSNGYGQLGNGTTTNSKVPVQVSNLTGAIRVAAGGEHSLALTSDGKVWAWGFNTDGELGNGTTTKSTVPVQVGNLTGVSTIAAGNFHSMALTSDGKVYTWGYNNYGQLGIGSTTSSSVPIQVTGI